VEWQAVKYKGCAPSKCSQQIGFSKERSKWLIGDIGFTAYSGKKKRINGEENVKRGEEKPNIVVKGTELFCLTHENLRPYAATLREIFLYFSQYVGLYC
jgi:hypothetical protein